MRIISGSAKGRRLSTPASSKNSSRIRPTSDRAREALFNIIGQDRIQKSVVLDLFAGTGALGLEALSRGASCAFFVDKHSPAIKIIRQNLSLCGFLQIATVIKRDLEKGLFFFNDALAKFWEEKTTQFFDIVFIDPPYDKGKCEFFLNELQSNNLITYDSLVIYEDRAKQTLPSKVGELVLHDQRKYGDTGFWFYKLE